MGESLRDQLVKAGLATGAQAKKAEREVRADALAKKRGQAGAKGEGGKGKGGGQGKGGKPGKHGAVQQDNQQPAADNSRSRAQKQREAKAARDKELARQRNEKYASKALRAEMKQLILQHDQRQAAKDDDAVPYNFVHGKRIKKLYVTRAQMEALSSGRLTIVNNDGNYHFVAPEVASRIAARDPKRIIVAHEKPQADAGEDDEYYAKFKVPDDLDW